MAAVIDFRYRTYTAYFSLTFTGGPLRIPSRPYVSLSEVCGLLTACC